MEELEIPPATCLDCGELYSNMGIDITFSDEQWKMIFPEENGLLCASCIVKRAGRLKKAIAIRAIIDFGKDNKTSVL